MTKPRLQIQTMKTNDLIPYARNAKQHPEEQVAQIAASIREFGMNDPSQFGMTRTVRRSSWKATAEYSPCRNSISRTIRSSALMT